jgi:hypothetical protein
MPPSVSGRPARSRILTTPAIVFGTVLGLALGEIVLRLWVSWWPPKTESGYVRFVRNQSRAGDAFAYPAALFRKASDPAVGWEPIPNAAVGKIRINSAGFRGPEIDAVPRSGTTRIAFLGDSETFGERLEEWETVPGLLERHLNAASRGSYEVLNFGVVGYNTVQEFAYLKYRVMAFSPSIVVLYYVFNDLEMTTPIYLDTPTVFRKLHLFWLGLYVHHSLRRVDDGIDRARTVADRYLALHASPYFEANERRIRDMAAYLDRHHIAFFVLISPEIYEVANFIDRYPYAPIHARLRSLGSSTVRVVDPLPRLAQTFRDPGQLWVTPTDPHKNHPANDVIASVLAEAITHRPGR